MGRTLHRNVLVGVTGSIAAYKSAVLVRELVKAGAQVQVIMTPSAHDFVTPLTLATLSKRPVLTEMFLRNGGGQWNDHVSLGRWADVLLIAPASANTLGKMATGICDNLLMATFLSADGAVYVAPAMDLEMFRDASVTNNLDILRERGVQVIGPESGELASGLEGLGRMTAPEDIVARLEQDLMSRSMMKGKRILVTAGPTQEAIDPVRYIGNRSTGKMGFALAEAAAARGAQVELVSGPTSLVSDRPGITRTNVVSAAEMATVCKRIAPDQDIVIMSAAVADHRPVAPVQKKIKKEEGTLDLQLERTEDILAALSRSRPEGQLVVGFALETDHALEHGSAKLQRKGLDLIVVNTLEDAGAGFGHDTNKVTLIRRKGEGTTAQDLPLMSKDRVAEHILDALEELLAHA